MIPAALAMPAGISHGLALAFGVLPAAIVGIIPRRRGRVRVVLLGALAGVPIFVGACLADFPVLAVAAIFALAIGAALLSTRRPVGRLVLTLALPMVGVGFSYDPGKGAGVALLIGAGSAYAWLVSLLWPERAAQPPLEAPSPPARAMLGYGVRLGCAGALAAAVGFAMGLDHVGWATAAALLVMRPSEEMQKLRSLDRVVAVAVGGLAAGALAWITDAPLPYAIAAAVVIAGVAATRPSRWYVTPLFTTFISLSLLVQGNPDTAGSRFNERLFETVLGVAFAYVFGLLVPRYVALRRRP